LPPMLPDQFRRLMEDIRKNGLKVPIVICQGKILDGWQRYQVCRRLKIEPCFEQFAGKQPLLGCWSLNIARRHLEKSQLAVLANEMTSCLMEEVKAERNSPPLAQEVVDNNVTQSQSCEPAEPETPLKKGGRRKKGRTRSLASEVFHVSEGYIQKAKELRETAPDLYDQVKAGKMKLT